MLLAVCAVRVAGFVGVLKFVEAPSGAAGLDFARFAVYGRKFSGASGFSSSFMALLGVSLSCTQCSRRSLFVFQWRRRAAYEYFTSKYVADLHAECDWLFGF